MMDARLHSGGHVLACIAERLWPEIKVVKGYHFPDSPYMEYANAVRQQQPASLIEAINEAICEVVKENASVFVSFEKQMQDVQSEQSPQSPQSPQSRRLVQFSPGWLDPCSGTHVKFLPELQGLEVTKLKYAKGLLIISYRI